MFKAVGEGFRSPNGTDYTPGGTPQCDGWDAHPTCGNGLHFSPTPAMARDYNRAAKRYVGCPLRVSELVVVGAAAGADKVKAPRVAGPCFEVDRWGKPEFDDETAHAWRTLLDPLDPAVAVEGVKRLLLEGRTWRPSASEVIAAARRDPSRPTYAEAHRLIFGSGGVLSARSSGGPFGTEGERQAAADRAALTRARELHPLVAAFTNAYGVRRLRQLPLDDPTWGNKRRDDLRAEYESFAERHDERQVAALAAGDGSPRGLRQLDPLAALEPPATPELEPSTQPVKEPHGVR